MRIHYQDSAGSRPGDSPAFSLVELLLCVALVGVLVVALLGGISGGMGIVAASRERVRSTQICLEKLEMMRLYTWTQLTTPGFVPMSFIEVLYPTNPTNTTSVGSAPPPGAGVVYYGQVSISGANVPANYTNSMREVAVSVTWTNGSAGRSNRLSTLVSQYGIQSYVTQ